MGDVCLVVGQFLKFPHLLDLDLGLLHKNYSLVDTSVLDTMILSIPVKKRSASKLCLLSILLPLSRNDKDILREEKSYKLDFDP